MVLGAILESVRRTGHDGAAGGRKTRSCHPRIRGDPTHQEHTDASFFPVLTELVRSVCDDMANYAEAKFHTLTVIVAQGLAFRYRTQFHHGAARLHLIAIASAEH